MNAPLDFLRLSLRGRWDAEARQAARHWAAQPDFDWGACLQAARQEFVLPLLYAAWHDAPDLPAPVASVLRQAHHWTARRNLFLLDHLAAALGSLHSAGILAIVLKGAALAGTLYGNPALRPMRDLDLLVRRDDTLRARQALSGLGYAAAKPEPRAGTALAFENEVTLVRSASMPVVLDLHWNLIDSPRYQHTIDVGWLWQTARPTRILQAPALTLGPAAQLIHLCAHAYFHHAGDGMLWMHDIAQFVRCWDTGDDAAQVIARSEAFELAPAVRAILRRVAAEWSITPPASLAHWISNDSAPAPQPPLRDPQRASHAAGRRFWDDLRAWPTWRHRLHFAYGNLFPSPAYMRQRYNIRHPALVWVYYPLRWLRGALSFFNPR